jgi:hypothetical protein
MDMTRKSTAWKPAKKWSAHVTEPCACARVCRLQGARPQADRRFAEAIGRKKPFAEVRSLPMGNVDAHFLYQLRGHEFAREPEAHARKG